MSSVLAAENLAKEYREGTSVLRVLKGVSVEARPGEALAVVGASGAGKSTLLHLLGLLDTPTEGRVLYGGQDLNRLRPAAQADVRNRRFGFVFQFFHLFPDFDALENVLMPEMVAAPLTAWLGRRKAVRNRGMELLERMGLADRARHRPSELSGGERQRVAIARALIRQPEVLFLDEPTGNLDSKTGRQILDLLLDLNRAHHQTIVMVTHDAELARNAHRVVHISDGRLVGG
jgi:lipoprotein-releasing system ATP-binding protein